MQRASREDAGVNGITHRLKQALRREPPSASAGAASKYLASSIPAASWVACRRAPLECWTSRASPRWAAARSRDGSRSFESRKCDRWFVCICVRAAEQGRAWVPFVAPGVARVRNMAQRLAVRTIARGLASEAGRQGAPGGRACSALRVQQAGSASTLCTAQRPAGDVLAPHLDVVPVGGADVGQRHDAGVADEHVKPGKRLGRRAHSRRRLPHRRKRLQVAVDLLHARARARHAGERSQRRVRARRGAVEHEHGRGLQAHGGHAGEVAGANVPGDVGAVQVVL